MRSGNYFRFPTCFLYLFHGGCRKVIGLYREGVGQFSIPEDLDQLLCTADISLLKQSFPVHGFASGETLQLPYIDQLIVYFVDVGKSTEFGESFGQAGLTTFEPIVRFSAGTGILSLVAPAGAIALAGSISSSSYLLMFACDLWK